MSFAARFGRTPAQGVVCSPEGRTRARGLVRSPAVRILVWLCCVLSMLTCTLSLSVAGEAAPFQAPLRFPADEGAHPDWKTEWWYVTGWLEDEAGHPRGFQITFFRNRGPADASHPSQFAPRQILLAHAALSDPAEGHILHEERASRSGFGLAEADLQNLAVHIEDWSLQRTADGSLSAHVAGRAFGLQLQLRSTSAPLLQGQQGLSRKGHDPRAFSWYYSLPQLEVQGTLQRPNAAPLKVHGRAWLDHEWSNAYVGDGARGWDWTGLNFLDGSALMAFRMRDAQGHSVWSAATWRDRDGKVTVLPDGALQFTPGRRWTSSVTGAQYPVEWTLRWADQEVALTPLMDDQEMDTRASTGTAYWEGAVIAKQAGRPVARGYLELTGYWKPLNF